MDERDKPLGFFDLPRELRNIIYQEFGYFTLQEGSATLNRVEIELTKHCSPDLRLVSRQLKDEFEEAMSRRDGEDSLSICLLNPPARIGWKHPTVDTFAATAGLISSKMYAVRVSVTNWTPKTGLSSTLARTVLPICPSVKLRHLTLGCSSNHGDMHRTITLAQKLLSQFSSINTFTMQMHLQLLHYPEISYSPSSRPGGGYYNQAVDSIRDMRFQQGLEFDFEVQLFFRHALMETVGRTWELQTMHRWPDLANENTIIYRAVPSDSKYAYRGFELFVHAVNVGDNLQAYLSTYTTRQRARIDDEDKRRKRQRRQ
ncbi:hypothetical protein KC347_g5743 [Hortaea werneckii]|nr:hypothetical protein KC347_g5743 [Hortaea werneckii]